MPPKRELLTLLVMITSGIIGNLYGFTLFPEVTLVFGSIFALLAMQIFGLYHGVVAASVISSVTFFSLGHPYAIPFMIAEVIVIGWLNDNKAALSMVVNDGLYWFCFGVPIFFLINHVVKPVPGYPLTVYTLFINGIANALVARLTFMALNLHSRKILFTMREGLFNLFALVILLPSLAFIVLESQQGGAMRSELHFGHYVQEVRITVVALLVTWIAVELLSRRFLHAVHSLQDISDGLTKRPESVSNIIWPTSLFLEIDQLIANFKEMATSMAHRFQETQHLNETLEARVRQRTIALQESEAKYRIVFENKVYAVYIFDLESRKLLDVNDAFVALYGYSRDEVLAGMRVEDISSWAEDADRIVQEATQEGTMFIPQRYHRKKDGCIFPVEIVAGPYLWQGRRVMFAIANDITERKRASEIVMERTLQLEDLTRNLEVRIETEVKRRHKNEQLLIQQAKLAAMGEMLGAIAHQWRQPLNSLGLCIQNIRDSYQFGELNQGYLDTTVRQAMEQIRHMSMTIDDFRDFFRPDKERAEFDTMLAVGEVLTLFSAQLSANDITATLTCRTHGRTFSDVAEIIPCAAKRTNGYKNEFEHVILNLVSNAKDAICERRERGGWRTVNTGASHLISRTWARCWSSP